MEGFEHPETFDHRGGRGVAQLHGGGTHANPVGSGRDLANQHRRRRAGDSDEVVLGDPEPVKTPPLGVLRQIDGVTQGRGGVAAGADRRQVQDRQRYHRFTAA
jgi:hypothetical protein